MDVLRGAASDASNRLSSTGGGGGRGSIFGFRNESRESLKAQMDSYGSVGTLFAIVSTISQSCAAVDWGLYRKARSRKKEDRAVISRHAVLNVWDNPNPHYSGFELREAAYQHFFLTGEMRLLIVKSQIAKGMPLQLWPIRPDRLEPIPDTNAFLAGFVYHSPDGEKIPLEPDEVLTVKMPHPNDPYRGLGAVQALLTDLDTSKMSAEWNRNFFLNGATPGGVIEVDRRMSDNEFRRFTQRWREQHQGIANAHRIALIEQGTWKDRKYTNADMQFAELRGLNRELVREAFAYPKIMLGTVDDVNRANAEVGEEMYGRWLVHPALYRLKQAVNKVLLPMFGVDPRDVELDFDNPVPESREQAAKDKDLRSKAAKALVEAGWQGPDVARLMDFPDMEWKDPKKNVNQDSGAAEESEAPDESGDEA